MTRARSLLRLGRRGYAAAGSPPAFAYTELFQAAKPKEVAWRQLSKEGVSTVDVMGHRVLRVSG